MLLKRAVESKTGPELSCLHIDGGAKYISNALKKFCKEESIVIEFTSLYILKQNSIVERSWHTLDIMKDAMLQVT